MSLQQFMAHTIALKYGRFDASVTTLLLKHGMAVRSFKPIIQ